MVRVNAKAVLPMSAEDYWAIRDTQEFWDIETRILKNASKTCAKELKDEEDKVTGRILKTKPDLSGVPSFLMSMLPEEGVVYTDHVSYITDDPVTPYAFRCRTTTNIYSEAANIRSYVRVTPLEGHPKACVQSIVMEIDIDVWLPGVGPAVEGLVKKGIVDGYNSLPAMVQDYIKQYLSDTDSGYEASDVELSPEILRNMTPRHSIEIDPSLLGAPVKPERRRSSIFGSFGSGSGGNRKRAATLA